MLTDTRMFTEEKHHFLKVKTPKSQLFGKLASPKALCLQDHDSNQFSTTKMPFTSWIASFPAFNGTDYSG